MVDFLLLKARLLTEGIRTDAEALGEVGTRYKEQNHGLFGWDFENHPELKIPDDFQLQDGTVVQFRLNSQSPYALRLNGERLHVCKGEETICGASLIPRPDFYARKTEGGNDMIRIGQVGGKDNLFFCYQNYCSHFSTNKQCAFCNLVSTSKTYGSVLKKKDREEIGEVAGAAFAEGLVHHISLTGGGFQAEKEVEVISGILESIRGHTGLDRVPESSSPRPPRAPLSGSIARLASALSGTAWRSGTRPSIKPSAQARPRSPHTPSSSPPSTRPWRPSAMAMCTSCS